MQNKINEPEIKDKRHLKKLTIFKIANPNLTEHWDASIIDYIPPKMIGEFPRFSTLLEFGEWSPSPNPHSHTLTLTLTLTHTLLHKFSCVTVTEK